MGFGVPQILGLSPHSYYHNTRSVLHPDSGLVSGMASCQRFSSSLPSQDSRFQHQSPAIVYSRGGRSLSVSPGTWQAGGAVPEPHRSVLVHTGSPVQSVPHPSIIHFSTANQQLLRAGEAPTLPPPLPDNPQMLYCDNYPSQPASHSPTHPQAHSAGIPPQPCTTVIQQKGRAAPGTGQMEGLGSAQRRVTIKEENLDQAYLDDGECKFMPPCFVSVKCNNVGRRGVGRRQLSDGYEQESK